jgi:glutathione synthase/RimK-type ligase-like ATP-grasp enzyme
MKRYDEYCSVEELCEAYGIKSLSQFITEKDDMNNKADEKAEEEKAKKKYNKNKDKDTAIPDKVVRPEKYEVNYAEYPDKYNNIFKHIIVFTNDRDSKNNKTLKNIEEAIKRLKKDGADVIPELHVFVAAKVDADDDVHEITLTDDKETFKISKESNLDTLVFARLGVQDEDNAEHAVKLLQDRGFLVLNPVAYSALACDKYESAVLFQKGNIPQPNFTLMTKEILYDEKMYAEAMKEVYPEWDSENTDNNEELTFVMKILDGHGGTGVAMCDGKKILAFLQMIFAIDPERKLILQKKEEADGGDIRVHVLTLRDKQIILAAMKRVKLGGDFRSNVSLGAEAEPVKLTPEQEQIALRTAQLSKLPWCAVDIMPLVKGSNPEIGDNVVLEINASPGTDGISEVIGENFVNVLLDNLTDPSLFYLQDKIAGFIESVTIKFDDNTEKQFLAKLDTGNSTKASCLEIGEFKEEGKNITFKVDGKEMTFEVLDHSDAIAGEVTYKRPIIMIPEITCGLRKLKNVPVSLVKAREKKATNMLLNRDAMSKLGYVINPNNAHILTEEMEKVKII